MALVSEIEDMMRESDLPCMTLTVATETADTLRSFGMTAEVVDLGDGRYMVRTL